MVAILAIVLYGVWGALRKFEAKVPTKASASDAKESNVNEKTSMNSSKYRLAPRYPLLLDQRSVACLLLFVGLAGYFLALGSQGPTGGLFTWAYNNVPFFSIMREPQKFLMLLALAYAVLFGWGMERLRNQNFSSQSIGALGATLLLGVALPLGYSANMFNGLGRQIGPSPLPSSYARADAIMGNGPGNILYLPWHLYMAYPFANGRVINNVGPSSFRRNVISGDNLELGNIQTQSTSPRSSYLVSLFANSAKIKSFGALVGPLGVRYVVLAKTVDWAFYDRWFNGQNDLRRIYASSSLVVWQNEDYDGVGLVAPKLTSVSGLSGLLNLERQHALGSRVMVDSVGARNLSITKHVNSNAAALSTVSAASLRVKQISPVTYEVGPGPRGWASIDVPYQKGWSFNGVPVRQSAEGTVLVRVGKQRGILTFTPWFRVRLGYIVSGATFLGILSLILLDRRRNSNGTFSVLDESIERL
jgi:hypothetical protein